MNLDYLKSFYYIAQCNSISKASEILHVTQPGLSMQLKNLESELGFSLLSRSNKGVLLTSEGEIVFDYAKSIFTLEENMYNSINSLEQKKNTLFIASCKTYGSYQLAFNICDFKDIHSGLDICMDTYNTSEVIDKILNHDYNIGIIKGHCSPEVMNMIEEIPFYDDEIVLCINPSYSKNEIKIKEVKRIPLIMRDSDSITYKMVKKFLNRSGIDMGDLDVLIRSNCTEIIKSSILKSCCASFVSKSCIQNELKNGTMKIIKISDLDNFDDLRFSYHLIKRKQYKLNTYEQSFCDFLLKNNTAEY
ncbi:LysR substrate-binding domain-containing protein [Proteocatella sphenisci]|uniref:LysR substrate-binding domain-containing protein n=1 Tax=Proteocatella sphenisci TaxID=181070 RepID=UPI00048B6EEF|nr:LysR substrate-binding domain-containing protein [Proteocatella sphenisci]